MLIGVKLLGSPNSPSTMVIHGAARRPMNRARACGAVGNLAWGLLLHTNDKPRKEIALGSDFILALRKDADLNVSDASKEAALFSAVITKCQAEAVPKLAPNTITRRHRRAVDLEERLS